MKAILLLQFFLFSAFPHQIFAGGRAEPEIKESRIRLYLLQERGNSSSWIQRYLLPQSLSFFTWTRFKVQGDEIETEAAGGYRVLSQQALMVDRIGEYELVAYELEVSAYDARCLEPDRLIAVSFDYGNATPKRLEQPVKRAFLEGIRAGGKSSGYIRLLELRYEGKGRFSARIQLKAGLRS